MILLKLHKNGNSEVVSLCDSNLIGKTFEEGKLLIDVSERFYKGEELPKEKVILINRIFLNLNKFNWIYCKALIKFRNLTKQGYGQFFQHCNYLKNLTYIINCIGEWDIELDFEIEDFNAFHNIMLDLRDKFSDIIKHYDFVIVMNEDKLDYYPGCYPQFK